jgi:inner membrane protein
MQIIGDLTYSTLALFTPSLIAIALLHKKINNYFFTQKNDTIMEKNQFHDEEDFIAASKKETVLATQSTTVSNHSNGITSSKTLIKGLITAGLILVMLIPTAFVSQLVKERESRQEEVVEEVASGWSGQQTLSGPYIYIPYQVTTQDSNKKDVLITKQLFLLPENLDVDGSIVPEIRLRSIYKVLLYRSDINTSGSFKITLPKDIDINSLQLSEAKICYGISDFKGIEEKLSINFNGAKYDFIPGLPTKEIETITVKPKESDENINAVATTKQVDAIGLSANIALTKEDFGRPINFDMHLKIKGSEGLHFVPLSGNSNFNIKSSWADPKFDGNSLPNYRDVNKDGFQAKWGFNSANLPFGTVLNDFNFSKQDLAFGINMIQPTDQYSKTMRSVKYAILFIGLTFALFFIIELTQHKPMHPVQYALIGMALVIFFTLLLSISEFLSFDYAYLLASFATISLITLYAKGHFKSFKSASIFGSLLTCLYVFIYILIQLEDAALLVGSVGLFIILALVMFGSRKINWYGENAIA